MELTEINTGQRIAGRYLVVSPLGEGGMGKVYLVEDTLLGGEHIALKVLHPDLNRDRNHTLRFLKEVQLTRRITHPNVVRTFDVGNFDGALYFTMEFAPGETLKDRIKGDVLSGRETALILIEICKGLAAIHQAGIVHRDLKPGNVIISAQGAVKIADFGVARTDFSDLTGHHEVVGSAAYMAPEVWRGSDVGPASDLYALGVLAYEAVTGEAPFEGEATPEIMCKHLEAVPVPPALKAPALETWMNFLILKLLEKEAHQRPRSAVEVLQFLEEALAGPAPGRSKSQRVSDVENGDPLVSEPPSRLRTQERRAAEERMSKEHAERIMAASRLIHGKHDELRVNLGVVRQRPILKQTEMRVDPARSEDDAHPSQSGKLKSFAQEWRVIPALFAAYLGLRALFGPTAALSKGLLIQAGSHSYPMFAASSLALMLLFACCVAGVPFFAVMLARFPVKRSALAAVKGTLVTMVLFAVLWGANAARITNRAFQSNLPFSLQRMVGATPATMHNVIEAALLLPLGTIYDPAPHPGRAELQTQKNPALADRLPYWICLLASAYALLCRFAVMLSAGTSLRHSKLLKTFMVLVIAYAAVCALIFQAGSVYPALHWSREKVLNFGPHSFAFDYTQMICGAVAWLFVGAAVLSAKRR